MKIERRFFVWDDKENNSLVKLGESVSDLLHRGVIINSREDDSEFTCIQNENIRIGAKQDVVRFIYFTQNSGDTLLRCDPFQFDYPATEPITEFLNTRYKQLHYKNIDQVKEKYTGDLLYLIFRDFNPSNIFLMRLQ